VIVTQYSRKFGFLTASEHWLKALYKGSDDDIKADYTKLETNIQRLESATMFATLATVIETKSEVKDLTVMTMQSLKVGTQTLSVSMETNVMMKSTSSTARDTFVMVKKLKEMMKKDEARKETEKVGGAKNKAKDSGAKKNAALNEIKRAFVSAAEPAIQLRDIQTSFVLGTFSWIAEEQSFKDFMDDDSSTPFLWIHGPPGIGKSCLAYSIIKKLWDATANDQKSSVSYFFFNEEIEPLRSVKAMLSTAIIQTAIANGKYRDEAAAELNRWAWSDDLHQLWDRYFAAMYPKDSDRKLFMVLDGLDEADDDERATIFEILTQIRKDELNMLF
jgi:DNA replication protein DnaC